MIFNFKTTDQNLVFYLGSFVVKSSSTTYIDVDSLSVDQLNELQEGINSNIVICTNFSSTDVLLAIKTAIRSKSPNVIVDTVQIPGPKGADGKDGAKGDKGDAGLGLPTGGIAGDILVKKSAVDYDTHFFALKDLFPLAHRINVKLDFDSNAHISKVTIVNTNVETIDVTDVSVIGVNSISINHGLQVFPKLVTFYSKWSDGQYHMKMPIFTSAAFSAASSSDMNVLSISGITASNVGIIASGDCFIDIIF